MQIVIDIPEREYKVICDNNYVAVCACPHLLSEAIRNGTPLPKANTLEEWKKDFISFVDELDMPRDDYNGIIEYINEIPAIVEADKGVWKTDT